MSLTLGLDVGTNSIGWAIVNEITRRIIDCGVRIFPEGVNVLKDGKELSKNAERRILKQIRIQYFRRKLRITILVALLEELGMIPDKYNRQEWFKLNPYYLRWYGLDNELTKLEFGRVLYHLAQRRGFLSNKKSRVDKQTKIDVTDKKSGRLGTQETQKRLDNGYRTIGEYLYTIFHIENEPYEFKERIRNRVIKRQNYIDEFELLWAKQKEFKPDFYTDELKFKIGDPKKGILFYQRDLQSQKKNIGKCLFEKGKTRCPISRIEFEEFRIWQLLNNIKLDDIPINYEMKKKFYDYIATQSSDIKISDLIKHNDLENKTINFDKDTKLPALHTNYQFNKIINKFTKDRLKNLDIDKLKYEMWDVLYFAKNNEWLHNHAQNRWDFSTEQAKALCKINLKDGFSKLSIKAIKNILPHLQNGRQYYDAVILGGVDNALAELKNELAPEEIHKIYNFIDGKLNIDMQVELETKDTLIGEIKKYLKENYNLSDKNLKKLYHPSEIEIKKSEDKLLKMPDNLRNPIVQKGLFELRKVVNALLIKYEKFDKINIELARELKSNSYQRERMRKQNAENEEKNKSAKNYFLDNGLTLHRGLILKYKLYEEMLKKNGSVISPYSHKQISIVQLFSENTQVDHIIPYSRSLDNSFSNKTLCFTWENEEKDNRTPYEYLSNDDTPQQWENCKKKALDIFEEVKAKKFRTEDLTTLESFANKQLNDTRYFSKYASQYLKIVCKNINTYSGGITSKLRHDWGLNSILFKNKEIIESKEDDKKNRDDHRHHAIDAIVIAVTNNKIEFKISNPEKFRFSNRNIIKLPWKNFRDDVEKAVSNILISIENRTRITTKKTTRKKKHGKTLETVGYSLRGQLHADTYYGKRMSPINKKYYYHSRIPIEELKSMKTINNIADPVIKRLVIDRLIENGIDIYSDKIKIKKGLFTRFNKETGLMESTLYLNNKNGEAVPINKVRIANNSTGALQLNDKINRYVETKNNYVVAIYEDEKGNYSELILTFLEAVKRQRNKIEIVPPYLEGAKLKFTMKLNEMFLIGTDIDSSEIQKLGKRQIFDNLYRVQNLSQGDYQFRKHIAATINYSSEVIRVRSMKALKEKNPIKVRIDVLGNIIILRE